MCRVLPKTTKFNAKIVYIVFCIPFGAFEHLKVYVDRTSKSLYAVNKGFH